jgi:NADPH-dependent ferric siderophore reductase
MPENDRILAMVGRPGGPLADASLWSLRVRDVLDVAGDYRRVIFEGPGLDEFSFHPGQDLMMRIPAAGGDTVNRRYTIRAADAGEGTVTVDMVVHGDGPGAIWAAKAAPGDDLDAIGPRGKVWVDDEADWHLFIGDETALPGMAVMVESLGANVPGIVVAELSELASGHEPQVRQDQDVSVTWIERGDAEPGEPQRLTAAAGKVELPDGSGHAYVSGEMKVVREVAQVLASRGLAGPAVSAKAYWRRGGANAPHGEPLDPDR